MNAKSDPDRYTTIAAPAVFCARLANNKAIALGRKVCSKDDKLVLVEAHEAWVRENCFLYVIQRALSGVRP